MREISTKKLKIGEHILVDGVEYVAEEGCCYDCPFGKSITCPCTQFCHVGGKLTKVENHIEIKEPHEKWHTGTPTEGEWYLCKSEHMVGYDVGYYVNGRFNRLHCFNQEDITEWQKIEP